jgi:hypothetical protein
VNKARKEKVNERRKKKGDIEFKIIKIYKSKKKKNKNKKTNKKKKII